MRGDPHAPWNPMGWSHKDFERFWQAMGFATTIAVIVAEIAGRL